MFNIFKSSFSYITNNAFISESLLYNDPGIEEYSEIFAPEEFYNTYSHSYILYSCHEFFQNILENDGFLYDYNDNMQLKRPRSYYTEKNYNLIGHWYPSYKMWLVIYKLNTIFDYFHKYSSDIFKL